jgi:LuxR family maltose regulon positive regulatory protein
LQAAENAIERADANESLRNLVAGHAASVRAFVLGLPGATQRNPEKLIELAQRAQTLLPEGEKNIRSVNAMLIGNGYTALANLPAAEKAFEQTVEDGVAGGNFYAAIYGPINLILIAMARGRLKDILQICETNIARFNQLSAGRILPAIGALYVLKGCVLLEENHLAEAEQDLTQGLSLLRWTGEFRTHVKGYSTLARLRFIQGDSAGVLESIRLLEEIRPEIAIYAEALRLRYLANDQIARELDKFNSLSDATGVDPVSEIHFRSRLNAAHALTRLAAQNPQAHPLADIHDYLTRQEKFASSHDLIGWLIEIWILRALMFQAEGKTRDAHSALLSALEASAPRGYFRLFLDEGRLLRPLLESVGRRIKDCDLSAYVKRLLDALPDDIPSSGRLRTSAELSERETEVLRLLADGESYKEVGEKLFLSLNTVQFHVKSIYRKLLVNKRTQAIEKARERKLI